MTYALRVELSGKTIQSIRRSMEKKKSVFSEKKYLDSLHLPSQIVGRLREVVKIMMHIQSLREGMMVPAISVYGRSGSGKSTVVRLVCENLQDIISFGFANLRKSKTVFGSVNSILSDIGSEPVKSSEGMNKAIEKIESKIEETLRSAKKKFYVLVLDEYDAIFYDTRGKPSDFMYKLLTITENLRGKDLWLCIITISNNALADYSLDDRVKSRIGSSEVFFSPYREDDIFAILNDRAKKAFLTKPDDKVLRYCAQICSDNWGDARRALDMLRIAGETSNGIWIRNEDIDKADKQLQKDRVSNIIKNASPHQKILLGAICSCTINLANCWVSTSSIYDIYVEIVPKNLKSVSYRRVEDLLKEIENSGLVVSHTNSRGRYGFGREYRLVMHPSQIGPLIDQEWWERSKRNFRSWYADFEYRGKVASRGRH